MSEFRVAKLRQLYETADASKNAVDWAKTRIYFEDHDSAIIEALERGEKATKITGQTSDGYHTFDELYDHRITLWLALCRAYGGAWRSRTHSDGSQFEGWFVLGLGKAAGEQITYHLPVSRWSEADFAETLDRAPLFDDHTPAEVLGRIMQLSDSGYRDEITRLRKLCGEAEFPVCAFANFHENQPPDTTLSNLAARLRAAADGREA